MSKIPVDSIPGCSLNDADTIQSLVAIPENSTTNWEKAYTYIEDIKDGRGFTCGLVGFTSGTHDLLMVVNELKKINANHPLVEFLPNLRKVDGTSSTKGLEGFAEKVKTLKDDQDWKKAQWVVLIRLYWKPSFDVCVKFNVKSPLSLYIIYDSYLNFGNVKWILRDMNASPAEEGKEAEWLTKFLISKRAYMKKDKSVGPCDRVDFQQKLVESGNFTLKRPISGIRCYGSKFTIK